MTTTRPAVRRPPCAACRMVLSSASKCSVNFMYNEYDGPATLDGTADHLIKTTQGQMEGQPACPPLVVGIHKGVEALAAGTAAQTMEQDRTIWKPMTAADGAVT